MAQDEVTQVPPSGLPEGKALPEAAKLWQAVTANEETRFNNLNTRALGVLTVATLVTSVAGFFAKDLLSTSTKLTGWVRGATALLLAVSVLLLAVAAGIAVLGVLFPHRRFAFGDNELTKNPASLKDDVGVFSLIVTEYSSIATTLQSRNSSKASSLRSAYVVVFLATAAISLGGILFAADAFLN